MVSIPLLIGNNSLLGYKFKAYSFFQATAITVKLGPYTSMHIYIGVGGGGPRGDGDICNSVNNKS